jgi:hypothetical protein
MATSEENEPAYHGKELWDKHALAIGKIALAWNTLHEALAEIYANLFDRSDWNLAIASWHSLTSDASQQEMLRSAAKTKFGVDSKAYTEINWLLEQIKQVLSHQRNFGIHTPFLILHRQNQTTEVLPNAITGNRRAAALAAGAKDALQEFSEYEKQIRMMFSFAIGLNYNISPLRMGAESWPTRPQLHLRAPSLNPKAG